MAIFLPVLSGLISFGVARIGLEAVKEYLSQILVMDLSYNSYESNDLIYLS